MEFSRYLRPARVFLLFLACIICALNAPAVQSDEQIVAAYQVEVGRIQSEMLAAGEDMARVTVLQKQMQALLAEVSTKVTPRTRAALEVSMKVINPLMERGIVYSDAVQKYTEAGGFDFTSGTSAELIDRRLEQLKEIERLNTELLKLANTLDTDIEAVLKASKLSAGDKAAFLKGFYASTNGRLGAIRAVRTLDTRLYVEVRGVYGQLREQLGKWFVKDGKLNFVNDDQVAIYNARNERINVIAERQAIAQRQALGAK